MCLAWVFFRAESVGRAVDYLRDLFDPSNWGGGAPLVPFGVLLAIAVGIGGQFVPKDFTARLMAGFSPRDAVAMGVILGVAVVIDTLGPQGVAPFIYFRF